jgi:hypothetical protein
MRKSLNKMIGGGNDPGLDEAYKVGGRYQVQQKCPVKSSVKDGATEVGELKPKDEVVLLSLSDENETAMGFVQPPSGTHGWVRLEPQVIRRQRLPGSWGIKERYRVNHPCTLRVDKSIQSPVLSELQAGQECLVLEIGLDCDQVSNKARLRAYVQVVNGEFLGWLSPEPQPGVRLLEPKNLLGPEVVEVHRNSMQGKGPAVRTSFRDSEESPWKDGAQYRTLEIQTLRDEKDLNSKATRKVPAGTMVKVLESAKVECPDLGLCPCMRVKVEEGTFTGHEGWLRCAAKDGHDLVDTRDQRGYDRAVEEIRRSQMAQIQEGRSVEQLVAQSAAVEEPPDNPDEGETTVIDQLPEADVTEEEPMNVEPLGPDPTDARSYMLKVEEPEIKVEKENDKKGFEDENLIQQEEYSSCYSCSCQRACRAGESSAK